MDSGRSEDLAGRAFDEHDALRLALERILGVADNSLQAYNDPESGGFFHRKVADNTPGDFSKASTATCAAFLIHAGRWNQPKRPWNGKADALLQKTIRRRPWTSADLPPDNAFTVSFLLDLIKNLTLVSNRTLNNAQQETVDSKLAKLRDQLIAGAGGVAIDDYPATSFITHKVIRALDRWNYLDEQAASVTRDFAWDRLYSESVNLETGRQDSDPFELAYAALSVSVTTPLDEMNPRQRDALRYCIAQFFDKQDKDSGVWPRSRPLFRYPKLGNAHCYEYELLVQLLSDPQIAPFLPEHLSALHRSVQHADETSIPIGSQGEIGWATGHLRAADTTAESWSTASVFHFCHLLHRLLTDCIRQDLFAYARTPYLSRPVVIVDPDVLPTAAIDIPDSFLDSVVELPDGSRSRLTGVLKQHFLGPIVKATRYVDQGRGLPEEVPNSAILFGPPGTSKTQLAKIVADALGWPLLTLDPSHLTRDGLDRLHAEANRVFTMLAAAEHMVVLLDEFDELVLDRDFYGVESSSRFLTTAMLPKIATLAKRRQIVYLLATNHIERFDDAISRAGRFDMVLPVMPPMLDEKLREFSGVADKMRTLGIFGDDTPSALRTVLEDLTYLEFKALAPRLQRAATKRAFETAVTAAQRQAIMYKQISGGSPDSPQNWKSLVSGELNRVRVPGIS